MNLTTPRLATFLLSLALTGLAVASLLHVHVPMVGAAVTGHRTGVLISSYAILALGVLMPGL